MVMAVSFLRPSAPAVNKIRPKKSHDKTSQSGLQKLYATIVLEVRFEAVLLALLVKWH